jgi:hypothetical protein
MPISRKAPKVDIRSLNISAGTKLDQTTQPVHNQTRSTDLPYHAVDKELRQIAFFSLPLIIILVLASYIDATKGWVVPLAERLMHISS